MLLRAVLIVAAGVSVYLNGLAAPPVLDDVITIDANPQIRELWSTAVLWPERELPVAGRPIVNVSLAINYALGGTSIAGYRAVNLLLHLLCALLLFALVHRVLMVLRDRDGDTSWPRDVAFAAALLWMLHPLTSEVVNYVTQRTESMMALAFLATLYASVRALDRRDARRWSVAAVVSCAIGMLCKESMVTAPVIVMLFDRVFMFASWNDAWRVRRRLYAGLCSTWLLLVAIVATGPRIRSAGFDTGVSAWTYLLNQSVVITRYLRLTIWPDSLVVYYGWPRTLGLADVLPYVALVMVLLAATIVAFRHRPWLAFAGAWFFITLAPTSSIVPIATEVGAERRMYLPLMALVVAAAVAASRTRLPRRGLLATTAALAVALGATTFARTREYSDSVVLAEKTLERWPTGVAHHMVGEALLRAGRRDEALSHLREAIKEAPRAHFTLGMQLYADGQLDEAIQELQAFIQLQPLLLEVPDAHLTVARALAMQQRWAEAAVEVRQAIAKAPRNADARELLADVLFNQEKAADAIVAYADYLQQRPADTGALTNMAIALASEGRLPEAVSAFRRVTDINPDDGEARRNLATVLLDAEALADAEVEARRAIALRPGDPVTYDVLGQALARQGRLEAALVEFERAVRVDPSYADGQRHLQQVRALLRR